MIGSSPSRAPTQIKGGISENDGAKLTARPRDAKRKPLKYAEEEVTTSRQRSEYSEETCPRSIQQDGGVGATTQSSSSSESPNTLNGSRTSTDSSRQSLNSSLLSDVGSAILSPEAQGALPQRAGPDGGGSLSLPDANTGLARLVDSLSEENILLKSSLQEKEMELEKLRKGLKTMIEITEEDQAELELLGRLRDTHCVEIDRLRSAQQSRQSEDRLSHYVHRLTCAIQSGALRGHSAAVPQADELVAQLNKASEILESIQAESQSLGFKNQVLLREVNGLRNQIDVIRSARSNEDAPPVEELLACDESSESLP